MKEIGHRLNEFDDCKIRIEEVSCLFRDLRMINIFYFIFIFILFNTQKYNLSKEYK